MIVDKLRCCRDFFGGAKARSELGLFGIPNLPWPGVHFDVVQALGAVGINLFGTALCDERSELEQSLPLASLDLGIGGLGDHAP